ncbi:hypothetical protein [Streptomyces antibioticus]|uniref:hypothetical protein n=1 Tax=Streptomyces antibioticus TaxID=1890 RepID=UPI0033AB76CD
MRGNLRPSAVAATPAATRVARVQRTTTTATLLVTVAVSALTGCVTVQAPAGPAPGAAVPSRAPVPRPDGRAGTRVVQAPAREALEMTGTGPSRGPERSAAPAERQQVAPARPRPAQPRPLPRPTRPEPRRPAAPRAEVPSVPRGGADVCALGRKYGGWKGDSPESTICDQTYGR